MIQNSLKAESFKEVSLGDLINFNPKHRKIETAIKVLLALSAVGIMTPLSGSALAGKIVLGVMISPQGVLAMQVASSVALGFLASRSSKPSAIKVLSCDAKVTVEDLISIEEAKIFKLMDFYQSVKNRPVEELLSEPKKKENSLFLWHLQLQYNLRLYQDPRVDAIKKAKPDVLMLQQPEKKLIDRLEREQGYRVVAKKTDKAYVLIKGKLPVHTVDKEDAVVGVGSDQFRICFGSHHLKQGQSLSQGSSMEAKGQGAHPVSYTHLTLPTTPYV